MTLTPRWMPAAFAFVFFVVPLFPPFIMLTAVTIPGVSLVPASFAVALLAIVAVIAVYAGALLVRRPVQRPPTMLPLFGWLGAALLSAVLGFNPAGGMLFIGIFGLGIVWHLALLRYYDAPGVSRAIFWSFLTSGALASLAAIVMVIARTPVDQYTIGHGRAIGTFILPGELAGYLIVFLPIAFAVARVSKTPALRTLAWIALALGLAALALTFSRAGWMGFAAAIAFLAFVSGRVRRRYAPVILLGGLAAVLIVFNAHHNPAENYTRLSIWQAGIEIVRRFPLTGVGPFDFARIYPLVRLPDGDITAFHAHSFLLTIFAELGIVGVIAVLWVWWRFAQTLHSELRTAPPAHATLAIAVAAGLVGTWVQGVIDTVSVVIFGLWLPSMALALVLAEHGLGEESA
ncbi:MAG TPA: O-antigen ligase family protein [Candidatus Baltobacteraceae bacterium]|nr:O-antigen ligase family protein [Candidatus Baltobacteraceae bacterium]